MIDNVVPIDAKKIHLKYLDKSHKLVTKTFKKRRNASRHLYKHYNIIFNVSYIDYYGSYIDATNDFLMYHFRVRGNQAQASACEMFHCFIEDYLNYIFDNTLDKYLNTISDEMFNKYFDELEHGLFHGIMVAFLCYMTNLDGKLVKHKKNMGKIYASATLHDFLKPNGVPQIKHDEKLVEYFPSLSKETYVHSRPPRHFRKKHLIVCDRLELRRYPDYEKWVDLRFHQLYNSMLPFTKKMLDAFYENLRSEFENIFKCIKETRSLVVYESELIPPETTSLFIHLIKTLEKKFQFFFESKINE